MIKEGHFDAQMALAWGVKDAGLALDVAMAVAGPVGGWVAAGLGFAAIYGFAAGAAVLGFALTQVLRLRARRMAAG